VNLFHP